MSLQEAEIEPLMDTEGMVEAAGSLYIHWTTPAIYVLPQQAVKKLEKDNTQVSQAFCNHNSVSDVGDANKVSQRGLHRSRSGNISTLLF